MNIRLGLTAEATGTGDAITATFNPSATLEDRKVLFVTAIAANTIINPTFAPDGLTAHVITKLGGQSLAVGDILGAGHVLLLQYNLASTRWELLNPSKLLTTSTLAQVVANGNNLNGLMAQSNDTFSKIYVEDGDVDLYYNNGSVFSRIILSALGTQINHTNQIDLDAPMVTFLQGYFTGMGNSFLAHLQPTYTLFEFAGNRKGSKLFMDADQIYSFWENTLSGVSGKVLVDTTNTKLEHTNLIELTAPSVTKNGSEIATQSYVDGMVAGLLDDRGSYDASGNVFPSSGGSGTAGAILKGDIWYISVGGTLGGQVVVAGDSVRSLVDSPAQTSSNWSILETNIGYVPENVANKTDTVSGNEASSTKYLSVKGFYDYLIGFTWLTDSIFGTWMNGLTGKTTPVDADGITIKDSADSNKAKFLSFTNLKAFLKTYFDTVYATAAALALKKSSYYIDGAFTGNFPAPADSTTYYYLIRGGAAQLSISTFGQPFLTTGTITTVAVHALHTNNPTTESVLIYLRNDTTGIDYTITLAWNDSYGASTSKSVVYTGLSIPIGNTTDKWVIKIITPAWVTNPTNWQWAWDFLIE